MDIKKTALGIELGSTRIKAVLIDEKHIPIASGSYEWENQLINNIWTYSLEDVHTGLKACFAELKKDVEEKYGIELTEVGIIGISGMMHGYLAFDAAGRQLAEFRTWRNTITGDAAARLSDLFAFNIPQRWSIAHFYQAMLNGEKHVSDVAYLTTLAGYIHWKLTGKKVIGIGEASGMFPIDSETKNYNAEMIRKFHSLTGIDLSCILPKVLCAGDDAGYLSAEGASLLDSSGMLKAGIPFAPCEGDAGTGMTATNSVRVHTGNISAGTSDFAMIVTDHALGVHREIDMVTTPSGMPVAMVHCNNCTSDINAWVNLLEEFTHLIGNPIDKGKLFSLLFPKALEGDPDCGGLMSYNYLSGEGVTDFDEGRPLFLRTPDSSFTLANFMRTHILSAAATLRIGMDILTETEHVTIERIYGHGGFFKTPEVGQRLLSAILNTPVSVMETAGEGGPYGMALLAMYRLQREKEETLEDYLDNKVFSTASSITIMADKNDVEGSDLFLKKYRNALPVERSATKNF